MNSFANQYELRRDKSISSKTTQSTTPQSTLPLWNHSDPTQSEQKNAVNPSLHIVNHSEEYTTYHPSQLNSPSQDEHALSIVETDTSQTRNVKPNKIKVLFEYNAEISRCGKNSEKWKKGTMKLVEHDPMMFQLSLEIEKQLKVNSQLTARTQLIYVNKTTLNGPVKVLILSFALKQQEFAENSSNFCKTRKEN